MHTKQVGALQNIKKDKLLKKCWLLKCFKFFCNSCVCSDLVRDTSLIGLFSELSAKTVAVYFCFYHSGNRFSKLLLISLLFTSIVWMVNNLSCRFMVRPQGSPPSVCRSLLTLLSPLFVGMLYDKSTQQQIQETSCRSERHPKWFEEKIGFGLLPVSSPKQSPLSWWMLQH